MKVERKLYMGIVEDNIDPNKKGKIKVRVQSLYNSIPTEDIPYASPFMDLAGKSFKVPSIGKIVNILFLTDDLYDPYYIFSENYNINLENKLKSLDNNEYVNFIAMLFDERTQIYANDEELTIDHLYNKITINKESINHELKDNSQKLNLGDRGADQEAVLGTRWFEWFNKFVNTLLQPTSLLGNLASPIVKPKIDKLLVEYLKIQPTFVSNHVKIVDNNEVSKLKRIPKTDTTKEDKSLIDNTIKLSSQFIGYNVDINQKNLQTKIENQNLKSCQTEMSSIPTSQLPQPEHEYHENETNFLPENGSYETRLINGKIVTVTDENRAEIDNMEKSIDDGVSKIVPSGSYKGQEYYIEGYSNQKNKTYNAYDIEKIEIETPDTEGEYDIYLTGDNLGKKPAIKFRNKLIISDYYPPLKKMMDAANSDGIKIVLNSAFRKYEEQYNLRIKNAPYNKKHNESFLTTSSSSNFIPATGRPGYSRHHYGIAFDISTGGGKNTAYKWLEKNALAFGFIRTVKSETWHWEYKPWEILNIRAWDKYARVPQEHSTWNKEEFQITETKQENTKITKVDVKQC